MEKQLEPTDCLERVRSYCDGLDVLGLPASKDRRC
jgi:hypothetical protein